VDYAAVFKKAEPYAYSSADDDATSTFVRKGRCDYRITFGLPPSGWRVRPACFPRAGLRCPAGLLPPGG
jgi:hypothetical protein